MVWRGDQDFDVIVCGGGAAGIGAALGAAKAGAKVCLVEKYGFLGGAATNAQVLAYCGLYQQGDKPVQAVAGVADEVVAELKALGLDGEPFRSATTGNWIVRLDSEILKYALDRLAARYRVHVLLHTRVAAATRTGSRLEGATLAGMDGRKHFVADAFVDASGDANLAMLSGESYRVGDGEGKLQALTLPIRIGGLSPGLEIDRCRLQQAIAEYNMSGRFPIARADGGIIIRLPLSRDMWWMVVDLALNNLGSESFTSAEMAGRAMAHEYLALLKRSVPGFENAYLVATGPQVGIRETRHPDARYMLTRADVTSGREFAEAVARAAWPIELHGDAGKPIYTPVGGRGYFHVPYDAIRSVSLENLWYGGRVIGASPEAYGSIRVMGTALATGQAAGIAAADYAGNSQRTDIARIQKRLREQHAIL